MKAIFIAYDQAQHENILEVLSRTNQKGYTIFPQVQGRGTNTGEPHMGSHAWPTMNSAILTVVEDNVVDVIMQRLRQIDIDNPMLGVRAFVWNIEQAI